jgi:hypothetical protein
MRATTRRKSCRWLVVLLLAGNYAQAQGPLAGFVEAKAHESNGSESPKIESVVVKVVGESIRGVQYYKRLVLNYSDSKYILTYSCEAMSVRCKCRKVEGKQVEANVAEEFQRVIGSLEDGGKLARCCDHPYTEIEIVFSDKSKKKITVGFDLSNGGAWRGKDIPAAETVFNLECEGPKPGP